MQSDDFREQITAVAGQTDMAPYVSLRDQRQMSIPIFPRSQHTLGCSLESFFARQSLNVVENKTLAALRDTLLPKLISGELRLKSGQTP